MVKGTPRRDGSGRLVGLFLVFLVEAPVFILMLMVILSFVGTPYVWVLVGMWLLTVFWWIFLVLDVHKDLGRSDLVGERYAEA